MNRSNVIWDLATEEEEEKLWGLVDTLPSLFFGDNGDWVRVVEDAYNTIKEIEKRNERSLDQAPIQVKN